MKPQKPSRMPVPYLTGAILLALGIAVYIIAMLPISNPPQCGDPGASPSHCIIGANIGAGMFAFLGMGLVIGGVLTLLGGAVHRFAKARNIRSSVSVPVSLAIVVTVLVAGWLYFVTLPAAKRAHSKASIAARQADFVAYKEPPTMHATTKQSDSVTAGPTIPGTVSVAIDLYSCKPGIAKITSDAGTAYILLSGVAPSKFFADIEPNASDCVFYVGKEPAAVAGQTWDGTLTEKCYGDIDQDRALDQEGVQVTDGSVILSHTANHCESLAAAAAKP